MLHSLEEITSDFEQLSDIQLLKTNIVLNEGNGHKGEAVVIRLVGTK